MCDENQPENIMHGLFWDRPVRNRTSSADLCITFSSPLLHPMGEARKSTLRPTLTGRRMHRICFFTKHLAYTYTPSHSVPLICCTYVYRGSWEAGGTAFETFIHKTALEESQQSSKASLTAEKRSVLSPEMTELIWPRAICRPRESIWSRKETISCVISCEERGYKLISAWSIIV